MAGPPWFDPVTVVTSGAGPPSPLAAPACALLLKPGNRTVYQLFSGGKQGAGTPDGFMYSFDVTTLTWTATPLPDVFTPRFVTACAAQSHRKTFFIGGAASIRARGAFTCGSPPGGYGYQAYHDSYLVDVDTLVWTSLPDMPANNGGARVRLHASDTVFALVRMQATSASESPMGRRRRSSTTDECMSPSPATAALRPLSSR
jgi:hypothetical protein